jgi:hypothetical protein
VNLLDRKSNDNITILKSPIAPGTKWDAPNGNREIIAVNTTVATPAGTFTDCITIKIAGQDSTLYEHFKEGVGMVKREFRSGDTKITSTLKRYTIAK